MGDERIKKSGANEMDNGQRNRIEAACEQIATDLLAMDQWRCTWRIEIDECVFKFKVEGYAKYGSERARRLIEMIEKYEQPFRMHLIDEDEPPACA